jgi:antitoxin PrlF
MEAAMPLLEIESSLTDRYQTTVPDAVRRALKLRKRDRIVYSVRDDGAVVLTRKPEPEESDPVMDRFLTFLARDMSAHPEHPRAIDTGLLARIQPLIAGVDVDLDAPLAPDPE